MESNPHHPYSPQFDDHYWSGGADEKSHVFLEGNNLPARFSQVAPNAEFTVAELGFGTALNFLLTAHVWAERTAPEAHLTYISYELFPLSAETLSPIHAHFRASLQALSHRFLALYNLQPAWNTLHLTPQITLRLYVGDALVGLKNHPQPADAWYLDGFSPSKNPDLWTPEIIKQVSENTLINGTTSTYSVATRIQKALTANGFDTAQIPGFPPKGAMLTAIKKRA